MKKLINKNSVVVTVHGGQFHADDAMCVALLQIGYGHENVAVRRAFKIEEGDDSDYILDIGREDSVSEDQIRLDHHQSDKGILTQVNGTDVPHCAASKLALFMFEDESENFRTAFLREVLVPLAAQDNGVDLGNEIRSNPFNFVHVLNGTWNENGSPAAQDDRFAQAVNLVREVLDRIITHIRAKEEAESIVRDAIANSSNGVIVLPRFAPWQEVVIAANNGVATWQLVCHPSNRGGYNLQVVPKKNGSFASWISIPETVGGLEGHIFHAHGAFAGFDTVEHALAAAKEIIG